MSNAYIIYRGEKVPVSVESYFQGADGMIANIKALSGFPFYSQDANSQGETFGAWNCNGYRVRTEFIMVEPVPAEAAYQVEQFTDAWCDPSLDDPRTEWERDWDDHCAEVQATRREDWDVTPFPKMPDIDFDTIEEIPF